MKIEGLSVFQKIFVWDVNFHNIFSPNAASRQPLAFEENSMTNLEVQGPLDDDVTFQECRIP